MKTMPTIEQIKGFYYAYHAGRKCGEGRYLGLKDGRLAWTSVPIYFPTNDDLRRAAGYLTKNRPWWCI